MKWTVCFVTLLFVSHFSKRFLFFKLLNSIVLVLCWKILSQMWTWYFENLSKKKGEFGAAQQVAVEL